MNKSNNQSRAFGSEALERTRMLKIEKMILESDNLEEVAEEIIEETYKDTDILKKDSIDRFIDMVVGKVKTGNYFVSNMAYPTKRMADELLEKKIIEMINIHLYPEIILRILKYFTRNIHDSDSNLYLANLITSGDIIKSLYDTYLLFKKDIFKTSSSERTINVKRVQQFPVTADDKFSSPLDAACRLKYILEFIAIKQDVSSIYTFRDIQLSNDKEI